ncbi:MAG: ATP-binding cassette domain-containing protein, partial [Bacteroidetes bacterium]
VALVGPSGGGKSTLADLVPRFYDPQEGRILLDGVDLRELSLYDLRSLIGIVSQEGLLFHDTVLQNIAYGEEQPDRAAVIEAARIAHAHDFIMALPQQYDTLIGERGTMLSGGQRQRIAIARAILRNPPLLILDEATSNLDTQSEKAVQAALDHLMRTRTSLIIAHRLSTIVHADRILVIEAGRIREQGRHEELLAMGGLYHELYALQVGGENTPR